MLDTKPRSHLSRELRHALREVQGTIIRLDSLPAAVAGVLDLKLVGRAKSALEELEAEITRALDALWPGE
jgi:hypothetical protein